MTDYLKELGLTLGGNGEWNGMEFYLILAVVVAVLMAGIVWVLFRFRKKGPREERLDEAGESVIDDQDTDILAPYDAESEREEGTAFFGSGEERQM